MLYLHLKAEISLGFCTYCTICDILYLHLKVEISLDRLGIKYVLACCKFLSLSICVCLVFGPRQANSVLIAYASREGSGEPAHPRSLARTFAARSYKQ